MAGEKKPWYMKHSELGESFRQFYNTCNQKTVLDNKTRELLQLALACVLRCPHCTRDHLKGALDTGATKQEVTETLLIAAQEGAGTQLSWLREAYTDYLGD
ncbi:MAG: carboxymuconolactone decarboxylase family protein [Chitinivibrionales bacterium]|nr:carboxymuconolactone decarboxylase family protein [Chitinivibrionales bacterium]MBD3356453.1 carboxymuconolactone decarboxylase family protein [Chitinivibrionales bacterium]